MIFGRVFTPQGVVRVPVQVSVQRSGLPQLIIQGYPGRSVRRLRQTLLSAIQASSWRLPRGRIVVDCDFPKQTQFWGEEAFGLTLFSALVSSQQTREKRKDVDVVGVLHLDGSTTLPPDLIGLAVAPGDHPVITGAVEARWSSLFPATNWKWVHTVEQLLQGEESVVAQATINSFPRASVPLASLDPLHALALGLVWGGGHSLLLFGSPGEGKTFSRAWLEALAPELSPSERVVQSQLVMDTEPSLSASVVVVPPTASLARWTDSRKGWLRRAALGSLWLDELPTCPVSVRTSLRSWLEHSDEYTRSLLRQGWSTSYVSTMNPCPCGRWGEPGCVCSPSGRANYFAKVSWPLIERFALQWRVEKTELAELRSTEESRQKMLQQILLARQKQRSRGEGWNSRLSPDQLPDVTLSGTAVWSHRLAAWSTRRQVQFLQVAQTLLDGEWASTVHGAYETAWLLCQGASALRKAG